MPADLFIFEPDVFHDGDGRERDDGLQACLKTAVNRMNDGDLTGAEDALRDGLRWNPASSRLWHLWAELRRKQEDPAGQRYALECAVGLCRDREKIFKHIKALDELTGHEHEYCDVCGQFGTIKAQYLYLGDSLTCPRCRAKAMKVGARKYAWTYLLIGLVLTLLGPVSFLVGGWALAAPVTNYLLFMIIILAMVPLHEAGHALTALALGGRVFGVQLGLGPRLWGFTVRGLTIDLHQYPIAGLTYLAFPTLPFIRLRYFLSVMMGPLIHLVVLLILLPHFHVLNLGGKIAWLEAAVLANALQLWNTGRPFGRSKLIANAGPDGTKLLAILRGRLTAEQIHLSYFFLKSQLAARIRDLATAKSAMTEGLRHYPDCHPLQTNQAIFAGALGQYVEAEADLQALLEEMTAPDAATQDHGDLAPEELTLLAIRNALGYYRALAVLDGADLGSALDEARANYRQAPWVSGVTGTLGSGFVAAGFPATGLMYLEMANRNPSIPGDPSEPDNLAWTALALRRIGADGRARRVLELARKTAPNDFVVGLVSAEVDGSGPHPPIDLTVGPC